jgi:hypothetical protein
MCVSFGEDVAIGIGVIGVAIGAILIQVGIYALVIYLIIRILLWAFGIHLGTLGL